MSGVNSPVVNPSLAAAVRGPIVMITIGALFLLQKFNIFQFEQTWPIILIVVGALALAGGGRRKRIGNADSSSQPPVMPSPPPDPLRGVRR